MVPLLFLLWLLWIPMFNSFVHYLFIFPFVDLFIYAVIYLCSCHIAR